MHPSDIFDPPYQLISRLQLGVSHFTHYKPLTNTAMQTVMFHEVTL